MSAARSRGRIRRIGLATLACLCGCIGPAGPAERDPFEPGVWPFWTADRLAWAGAKHARAAGPFLEWESADAFRRFALRPLLSREVRGDESRWDLLYPLAARRDTPERDEAWLLLLGGTRRDSGSLRAEQLLGLGFRGRTASGRRYGGVFPFGGRFLERMGFDRVDFVLWPLFARAVRGEYTETQLLWPLFAWGRGDGRFKLRVWPLFGIERHQGVFERRFWLWPFVHRRLERLDAPQPSRTFYVLPFYGRRDVGPWHSRFYAFPLYGRQWDDSRPEFSSLDLLWPLWSRTRDADGGTLAFRPLFSWARRGPETRTRLLLGAFGTTVTRSARVDERWWRLLWVGRVGRRQEAGARIQRMELWPFLRSVRATDSSGLESGFVRVPYLLPMRGLEPDRWDLNWNRLFQVYGSRWQGLERRSSWLWGLRETRDAPGEHWVSWGGWLHVGRVDPTLAMREQRLTPEVPER